MPHKKLKKGYYEIEYILGKKQKNNEIYYLIKWKDYDSDYNTWEPVRNLGSVQDLIDEYEAKEKDQ